MRVSIFIKALACIGLCAASPVHAATVTLDISIDFDVVKVRHDCSGNVYPEPLPGPGACNLFQPLSLGETYIGSIKLSGQFLAAGDVFGFVSGKITCLLGSERCVIQNSPAGIPGQSGNIFGPQIISWQNIVSGSSSTFDFDVPAGTGSYRWEDDGFPISSEQRFAFSNLTISGFPAPAPVPLPASLSFLLAGLGAFGMLRRRSVRADAQPFLCEPCHDA